MPSGPQLETRLRRMVEARGGMCVKLAGGPRGVPDRLVLWPGGKACFVEAKGGGDRMRPEQERMHPRLRRCGFPVWTVETYADVREFCERYTVNFSSIL
jgi:hypothetical protein